MSKEQEKMSTSRFSRTGEFIKTGARLGSNYLKHYSKKLVNGESDEEALQEKNATDIYDALSNLKGSALKVAQMMSMDQGIMPQAYSEKFEQAQYSAPPLSFPLVVKTFRKSLGKSLGEVFDAFSKKAVAAASIGQVHQAEKDGQKLAVKVQYPGVANSISSDLKIVRPIVGQMFNISNKEMDHYLEEVEKRLLEETDYELELKRSQEIPKACASIEGLTFPQYYPEYSGSHVLTMDWLEGRHLNDFLKTNPNQDTRNRVGQIIWDFYDYQIHKLMQLHADPHPGNFLFREDGTVGIIDFGCVKEFAQDFHDHYFQLMQPAIDEDKKRFNELLENLNFILSSDSPEEKAHFRETYQMILRLLGQPFFSEEFDFADDAYFNKVYGLSDVYQNDKMLRNAKAARGPKDAIYLNRTYFGLYTILHLLGAKVQTRSYVHDLFLEAPKQ